MKNRTALIALAVALPLGLAACSSDASSASADKPMTSSAAAPTTSAAPMPSTSSEMADPAAQVFGDACSAVPKDGKGSFTGMATDPVATAASNNPLLSTLVTAVKTAGLVDTLNSGKDITVFAPTNAAFAKIPGADLKKVLADKPTLTKVLTNHVVAGRLSPDQLAGEHMTLAGTTITVSGSGQDFTVGKDAHVICGNVPTGNATVYIIDSVLMP
ncbi:MAG: fasciclin domain-containing protein [Intrasporangium sp.]|uniref:fasciclin domain-containing protein n=1 Tax=Intrasporangium sp. TaxID=1925024 RepID=UPI002648E69E|nr:fasciclin domain-containing protein [Intrasporangium sp.]MDN5796181.1 fasciclin domain-containing protein [Intrasporangium sp.]